MARALLAFWIVLVGVVAGAPAYASFDPPGLADDAEAYASSLLAKAPPQPQPANRDKALAEGAAALAGKAPAKAVAPLERAVTLGADTTATWLDLSRAWAAGPSPNRKRALESARRGYTVAVDATLREAALTRLADLLETDLGRPDLALSALRELTSAEDWRQSADPNRIAAVEERVRTLLRRVGLTVRSVRVDADSASGPRACVRFSESLGGARFDDYVRVEPSAPTAASAKGDELCVSGLAHGTAYTLTLRQGLPGTDGIVLAKDETYTVRVPDRSPTVAFRGSAFILPRGSAEGIPITAVNVDAVTLKVFRIGDRGLATSLRNNQVMTGLSIWEMGDLRDDTGELVWEGRMALPPAPRNTETTAALPFRQAVPQPQPGLYAIAAAPADLPDEEIPYQRATQWVLITDIGLTVMEGADGMAVFARSLADATPLGGVEVALVARNNQELGRVTTGPDGRAGFPAGLAKAGGGRRPIAVMAYAGEDYAVLDLTRPAFDLADRGVGGRTAPGPMDAFVHSDRGVYRQGETVNLAIVLRDDRTIGVAGMPLTVKVLRPSGTEYASTVVTSGPGGGAVLPVRLSRTAPLGGWSVRVLADPNGEPVGTLAFQVDDFVPERLAVDLAPSAPRLVPDEPFAVTAKARFLYGPPAAGLDGTAELALQADPNPFPDRPGFRFGLVQETVTARVEPLDLPETDAAGTSRIDVTLPPLPDTTKPLRAEIRVAVAEPGGRPTRETVTVPVRLQPYLLGVRPRFEGDRLGEGQEAAFDVVALAADGTAIAKSGLSWELVEEDTTFHWFYRDGRYNYRAITRDVSRASGTLAVGAAGPAALSGGTLPWGRYRVEVTDRATGVATSVRFQSGWVASADAGDAPDKLEVSTDKPAYRAGEVARVHLKPPFAGEVLLTVATDRLLDSRSLSVPAEGTTVDVPVNADWGAGAYVTATVYRPPVKGRERQPVRAIGLAWLAIDPAERALAVTVEAPETVRPRQSLDVTVRVAQSAPAEDAYVTLAAVDEGILQLTDFAAPDPVRHFYGKRRLGVEIRDDYGRLIDALDGPFGSLRQGGDASGAGLPVVPFTVVSLFHGPVRVADDGTARIALDIPDFTGELRLMAVAWSKTRIGAAARPLTVRDPVVADAALPRFLAPGDGSQVTVNLHNVGGPGGAYAVAVRGEGAVSVAGAEQSIELATGERRTLVLPLTGTAAGIGRVTLSLGGPDGTVLEHDYGLTVRPARPAETRFTAQTVAPGASNRFGTPLLAAYVPGTASVAVTYSSAPPFDVAGILKALDRYPYGCLEQTVSRALPLLFVDAVEGALGTPGGRDAAAPARIDEAVVRTLDRQRYDGGFGLWSASDEGRPWLNAYAMEFLLRARAKGHAVPDTPLRNGLDWLRRHAVDGGTAPEDLASRAYALYVLALSGAITPGPARYFADAFLDRLPTPLARAQVGAALARLGDRARAERAFAGATQRLARDPWWVDYGSTVRDSAALVTLLSEAGMASGRIDALVDRLPRGERAVAETSTQEQAWLVLAADTLMTGTAPATVSVGGDTRSGDRVVLTPSTADLAAGLSVANAGAAPVWQAVSVSGVPAVPPPAAREGLRIKRQFLTRAGEPVNLDDIHQNDVFVIVLEGEANTGVHHEAVVVHPLPAGWEIEAARVDGGTLGWLGDVTTPLTVEARDDRYVAALDLTEDETTFRLAYLVRAVTPGTYELPGAMVEDMYKPRFFARQGTGRIVVHPAR